MSTVTEFLNTHFSLFGIPGTNLVLGILVIILSLLTRRIFSLWVLKRLKKFTEKTNTEIDDALLDILNPPLSFLILLIGFWVARTVLGLPERVDVTLTKWLSLGFVVLICWLVYRSADVFTEYLEKAARRTETELDDLLVPYLGKLIKVVAILFIFLKIAEIILGLSAAALLGLLGGMGLTLGLVFKDIIANWFGCGVIYIDNLFREGDWVQLDNGSTVDADVEEIGLRSTRFRNFDKTVSIVPNATIATAVVKNWSRMYKRRVKFNLSIDGISTDMLENVLEGIRELLSTDEGVHQEFHMVNFREFEGNTRVIRLYYFTTTTVWKDHEQVRENVNLKVLKLLEDKGIDKLAYTIVDLSDDRPRDYQQQVSTKE